MFKFIIFSFLILSSHSVYANPSQWKISEGGNDHYYEVKVHPHGLSWELAKSIAEASGGYLAEITSQQENDFIYNLSLSTANAWVFGPGNNNYGPYLGGIQILDFNLEEPDEGWYWYTSQALSYTNWQTGEPNNAYGLGLGANEDVIHFLNGNGWNDIPGSNNGEIRSFVIEYDTLPISQSVPIPMFFVLVFFVALLSVARIKTA